MSMSNETTNLSADEFQDLAVDNLAYVKPMPQEGQAMFSIHAANGQQVAMAPSRDHAFALIRTNNLLPVSVH